MSPVSDPLVADSAGTMSPVVGCDAPLDELDEVELGAVDEPWSCDARTSAPCCAWAALDAALCCCCAC